MLTITIDEIQKNFTSYLHQVAAGESIIIMESGKAIAEIKPVPNIMEKLDYPECFFHPILITLIPLQK